MAFDGNGAFVRLYNWVQDRINGIKIRADRMDAEMDGMATGLSNTICRDGQSTTTAQIDFAQGIGTDTVAEESAGAGVTVDGVLMKDGRVDWTQASNVASASTAAIGAIDGNYVVITGTATITSFGTGTAGMTRIVRFSGALTLTHNATSLILATGANRTTADGDVAIFVSEGSSNWREVLYSPQAGYQPLDADLTALAGLTSAADKVPYFTGSEAAGLLDFNDEDDMSSDSATAVASQQSVKAYVDGAVSSADERAFAWVNFDGTGTVAIRDSFNVSSITDNGTGDYTINFTSAAANANYAALVSCGDTGAGSGPRRFVAVGAYGTTSVRLTVWSTTVVEDVDTVTAAIFGGS